MARPIDQEQPAMASEPLSAAKYRVEGLGFGRGAWDVVPTDLGDFLADGGLHVGDVDGVLEECDGQAVACCGSTRW